MQHGQSVHDSFYLDGALWQRGRNVLVFALLLAVVLCAFGYATDKVRFTQSWLVAFTFAITVILGGTFFVMVQYLTGSAWSVTVRRFMEEHHGHHSGGPDPLCAGGAGRFRSCTPGPSPKFSSWPAVAAKASYLTEQFFVVRGIIFFALWSFFAVGIWRTSTRQDQTRSIQQMHTASRFSAPGLLAIMLTGTLASFDWIMSLDPTWYSTIFGIYNLGGGALAFFGIIVLLCLGLQRAGVMTKAITDEHYHDLGKWMFALTVFWALHCVLAVPADLVRQHSGRDHLLPRAVGRLLARLERTPAVRAGSCWPFVVLIRRGSKRNKGLMAGFAVWVILMHFVDQYWLIMPNFYPHGFSLHWLDLAALLAVVSVLGLAFWSRMRKHAIAPVGDMRFEQGLNFENV